MTALSRRVAAVLGLAEDRLERLAGGDLSDVLLIRREDGRCTVAKGGPAAGTEAAMLRKLLATGIPSPRVEGEHSGVLLLEYVENDGIFSARAWRDVGAWVRKLHDNRGERFGWPVDYSLGTVELDNRETDDWPAFWGQQRLAATARVLDRPWRERIDALVDRIADRLPSAPPPSLLHGDLWSGNILVRDGHLAALVDPACYHGDAEVDLAMLSLFGQPPDAFWVAYGRLEPGWEERRDIYQLFPALVHLRLFGPSYGPMVDRLLKRLGY